MARLSTAFGPDVLPGKLLLLTLTVRNCDVEELRSELSSISRAWAKMRRRDAFPASGYLRAVEVTRGKDGDMRAHPHIHALLHVPQSYGGRSYLSVDDWKSLWASCAKLDYEPVLDVRRVRDRAGAEVGSGNWGAILEVAKYTVKRSDLQAPPRWIGGVAEAIHGTRQIALGGDMAAIVKAATGHDDADDDPATAIDPDPDAPLCDPINDGRTRWYRWGRGGYAT